MMIAGVYSFNGGRETLESKYGDELDQVKRIIMAVDSRQHKAKTSREKNIPGRWLYSPLAINKAFKIFFENLDWHNRRVMCQYPVRYYTDEYQPSPLTSDAFHDMDFVRNRVGVDVNFKRKTSMICSISAKMTIFNKLNLIDVGIGIVPVKEFAAEMSSGVSYFEQFVWDLEQRGVCNIDIPVLILGVAA
ncbi:MAG: BglII/BstYI family type II restriction endonuclease [Candidatus Competibacteraceae bacterium]